MQRVTAIAWLTLKAAFRYRLILALSVALLAGVVILPLMIKSDGTARGFTQILLTYTMILITTLLGFSTLWLACGTMASDVEDGSMQMVAVKPVARWQIWLGKLLGILAVNAILLIASAVAVFFLLQWRARELAPEEQEVLRNEVLVARGSARELAPDYEADADLLLQERLQESAVPVNDVEFVRNQIREQIKGRLELVPPGYRRAWEVPLGLDSDELSDRPLYLRVKFYAAQPNSSGTYPGFFVVGPFDSPGAYRTEMKNLASDTFHEIEVPPGAYVSNGALQVSFVNRSGSYLSFPLTEGLEVLYREGGFALNFARGVAIIFFWLTLLACVGLAAASFLSFPVAAFFSLGILVVGLSSGTLSQIIEQGTVLEVNHETGVADGPAWIDHIALPVFGALLRVINLVQGFSPIDSLSSGRSVSWGDLFRALLQVCFLMGGIFAAVGVATFTRRELATAHTSQ